MERTRKQRQEIEVIEKEKRLGALRGCGLAQMKVLPDGISVKISTSLCSIPIRPFPTKSRIVRTRPTRPVSLQLCPGFTSTRFEMRMRVQRLLAVLCGQTASGPRASANRTA